jgi:hypothetical protein
MELKSYLLFSFLTLLVAGCHSASPEPSTEHEPNAVAYRVLDVDQLDQQQQRQQQVALEARDELFQRLSTRLTEVLTESGPTSAIQVCKSDAPQLASEVSEQCGVRIGRTANRLRNPDNEPPAWARQLVQQQVADPQVVALEDRQLGVLLPIYLKAACVLCHGPKEEIVPDVRASLVAHYPQDQATGFREGDLRGWFWVEVPAQD